MRETQNTEKQTMSTMTITTPTDTAGELAIFKIEFSSEKFQEVMEWIELLVKPSDVALAEEMGIWTIV